MFLWCPQKSWETQCHCTSRLSYTKKFLCFTWAQNFSEGESVLLQTVQCWEHCIYRWMEAYRSGLNNTTDARIRVKNFNLKKYKSHRRVPEMVARAFDWVYTIYCTYAPIWAFRNIISHPVLSQLKIPLGDLFLSFKGTLSHEELKNVFFGRWKFLKFSGD